MAMYLKDRYDFIYKLDAFRELKKIWSEVDLKAMEEAYKKAYPEN